MITEHATPPGLCNLARQPQNRTSRQGEAKILDRQPQSLGGPKRLAAARWLGISLFMTMSPLVRAAEKSGYTLLNPVPAALMRELSTDRPDLTESAYTVDAGHFQIEMDVVNYSHNRADSVRTETLGIAPLNLKAGLCNNVDFQLVLEPYTSVRIKDEKNGTVERHRGFGDITPRVKINLWGNDSGPTALALMPFVKFPSNQDNLGNDAVEGGLIVPFACELPAGWGMGATSALGCMEDASGGGHHPEFVNSIAFGHDIAGKLAGYIEFFSLVSTDDNARWIGSVDCGFTYALTADIQLDAGINIGVTSSAPDFNPFLGLAWRF
ncbi:MAG: transporter [Pyrinomonadaceae bacterium]